MHINKHVNAYQSNTNNNDTKKKKKSKHEKYVKYSRVNPKMVP